MNYISVLEKYIRDTDISEMSEDAIDFRSFVSEKTAELLFSYLEKDYDTLHTQLQKLRKLRNELNEILKTHDSPLVSASQYVQTYNIFNKIIQEEIEEKQFSDEIEIIIENYEDAKTVLLYIYQHPYVSFENVLNNMEISHDILIKILNLLEAVQCVISIKCNNMLYYDLSLNGRTYMQNISY